MLSYRFDFAPLYAKLKTLPLLARCRSFVMWHLGSPSGSNVLFASSEIVELRLAANLLSI